MKAIQIVRALGPIDWKSVQRESLQAWMLTLPFLILALLRFAVPAVTEWLLREFQFDLVPYHALMVSYFVVLFVPMVLGQVLGFLLIDEREADTLTALFVTPLSVTGYLAYRIGLPVLLSMALALALLPAAGLVSLPWRQVLPVAFIAALEAPMIALFLASVARNKVQGFALGKVMGSLQLIPIAVFFVDPPLQYLAGLLPTYWPVKAFWVAHQGGDGFALWVALGLAVHVGVLALLGRWFARTVRA